MVRHQSASETQARSVGLAEVYDRPIAQFMASLQPVMQKDVLRLSSGMCFGEQTKYASWTVPEKCQFDTVEIIEITDVQFGHVACKYHRVIEYRDWVLAKPNRFMIWTGDMIDAWAMWSPGRGFEQIGDPQSQVYKFCEVWASARHRILGYVGGNHERRAIPGFGDLGILIAAFLQIPYSNGKQLIDVHFGRHQPFKITQWHGMGGARTKGSIANNLHRFASQGDSSFYAMGHHHQAMVVPGWKEHRDSNQRIRLQKYIAAIGTSFLETVNTYGEIAGYSGSDVLMPRAVIDKDGGFEVTLK